MTTIDQLRKTAIKPPRFCGTGGLKLLTSDGIFRFYNESLVPINNREIHTHTNSFRSQILKGTLRQVFYDVVESDQETNYQLTEGQCKKGCQPEVIIENVEIIETLRIDTCAGSEYSLKSTVFHEVEFITDTIITMIDSCVKGPVPKFVRDKRIGYICPWGDTFISPKECYEIIEVMLND